MTDSMTYKGYIASMVFDPEDKIIVGCVLDIDDIVSLHGSSVTEFETNVHAAVEGCLAASSSGTSLDKWAEAALGRAARKAPVRGGARGAN